MSKIKKEKRIKFALEQETRLWQTTFDALNDSVFIIDLKNKILQCNKATLDFFKKSSIQEVIGHSCCELMHNKSQPVEWCPMVRMMESNLRESSTAQIGDKWVEVSADPIFDDENNLIGAVHLITDITQNKLTELRLRKSEEKYHGLFDSFPHFIGLIDMQGILIECNIAINNFLSRHTRDDLIGLNFIQILSIIDKNKDLVPKFQELMQQTIADGELKSFEFKIYRSRGDFLWLHIEGSAILIGGQKFIQFIIQEITTRKVTEEKLRKSELKLQERVKELGCIYKVSKLIDNPNNSPEALIYGTLELIPPALQFTELARVRILYKHNEYTPIDFKKSEWKLTVTETINGEEIIIEIHYLENIPFLKEEYDLIREIIIRLKSCLEEREAQMKLKESEENYRRIFDKSPNLIYITDWHGNILDANPAWFEKINISSEEMLKMKITDFFAGENRYKLKEIIRRIRAGEEIKGIEMKANNLLGHIFDFEIDTVPIQEDGKIIHFLNIAKDVSERKEMERKLEESEKRYRLISENAYDLVSILNDQIKYEYVNEQAFLKIMGRSKKDLLGKRPLKWAHPEDIEKCINTFKEGFESGEANIQARFKDKSGKYLWLDIKGKTFTDFDGKKKALIISRDITNQKLARDKLIESEVKFRTITEHSNLGIMIIQQGHFKYVNQAMSRINGYTIEEILNWSLKDMVNLVHPEDLPNVIGQFNRNISSTGKQCANNIYRIVTRNGTVKWVETYGKEITYNGENASLITVIDRTEIIETELKLKESEERYRLIYENANDLIRVLNDKFEFEYLNEKVHKRILGYSKEDLIGQTHLPFLHPEDRRHAIRSTIRNLKEGEGSYQARFKDKNGIYRWFEFSGTIFFDSNGEKKILSIARDISERKRAEEKLKKSEERYRIISQNADENLFIFDMNLNLIYNDTSVPNILGYTYEEMKDLKITDYNVSSSLKVAFRAYKEELRNERRKLKDPKRIRTFEVEQIHKNGSIVNVETRFTFLRDENGIATGILGLSRNITKRKQAEQKLRESEEKYRLISETAYDLIAMLNKRFKYEYINENAFKQILGYSSSDILGKSALKFIHPDDVSKITKTLFEGFKQGLGEGILRLKHKEGHWVWIEAKGKTFLDKDGELKAIVISRDITERKKSEEQLKESEIKYREAYNRATFYKDIFGHDMNNILTVINSSADLIPYYLGESEKSKNIRSIINILQNQVNRGAKLISNINALSELEESVIPIEPVNINMYLENSIEFIKTSFKERDLKIDVDSNGSNFKAQANQLLREVFDNVLINAIKYNDNSTVEILVKVSEEILDNGSFVKLEFIDNGIGVPDDRKTMIFKRGNRELKGSKGMGIGLSLVKKILKSYKSKIWVEDKVKGDYSKGSKFVFLIPNFVDA